ncbi:3'-5' DNA helicase [Teratosphaeriaceae sp. CCFEE 6253]|nr:3'-5' DNA helicase [Teratosphaeriaceae sp. CCFEE 6253]
MPHSDDFGFDDDDTAFLEAATQVEASQHHGGSFAPSPRPTKRRRIRRGPRQLDGATSDVLEWSESDDDAQSPPGTLTQLHPTVAHTQATAIGDGDNEDADYYFEGEGAIVTDASVKQSRFKIHVPKNAVQLHDSIFTQAQADLDSDPTEFRGAIWKKPKRPPPPLFDPVLNGKQAAVANGHAFVARTFGQQMTLNGHLQRAGGARSKQQTDQDAALAARWQAEEDEMLADLGLARDENVQFAEAQLPSMHEELADLPSDAFESSASERPTGADVIEISSSQHIGASQMPDRGLRRPQAGLKQMTIFGQPATQGISASQAAKKKHAWPLKAREEAPTHHDLDEKAMETWVYPTNLGTTRDYQYNIVNRSLYHNTLVALPTGLGKTFIAATVMLNYYRWTTTAQIIFMAPTKPLIAQQMDACYHIVGISRHDTVLMTGETTPAVRADEWLARRVFFMTPQTVINDLKTGICDPKRVVLVVVDEAHKATGAYAYTEVISFLRRFNTSFRVLALTATPGSTVEAVQAVIDHLGIARVELRTEQSLDIRAYTHEKQTDTEVFNYSDEQALIMEHMSKAIKPVLQKLNTHNAYWSKDPMGLSAFGLQQARAKWAQSDAGRKAPMSVKGMVQGIFTSLASLAHSIGLLKFHGIGPFYSGVHKFRNEVESGATKSRNSKEIVQHEDYVKMVSRMEGWMNNKDFIGHPKLQYLREVVLNHFLDAGEGALGADAPPSATRVMVFASYRDSTEEICRVLKRNEPMIRPHVFVGQAGSATSEGMNQKKQNQVIQDFKAGKFNTLVATSIGEEGLDIGDVDLIVCYDASSSPIRMLQRIGRTGRKRVGKVVLLLMSGKEENDYEKAKDNYAFIQKSIADESKYNYRDDQSPRILPREVRPAVDKRVIEIPIENSQPIDLNEKSRRGKGKPKKRPPKKFHMPDGVRTGFVKASKVGSEGEELESDEAPAPQKRKTPSSKAAPAKAKKPPPEPESDVAQVPYLEDVLLNPAQQRELERKYACTAADQDMLIRAPDPMQCPEAFKDLDGTKYIRHGRAAKTAARGLREMHGIDDEKIARMKVLLDRNLLLTGGLAGVRRLASPSSESDDDDELPANPLPTMKVKLKSKAKPKPRTPAPAKNPPGRPRKTQNLQRAASHGSAAMEGNSDSEPEATPADMRLATQGIELGSEDTDGEDRDEQPDSEDEAFIARSDEVMETVSSSIASSGAEVNKVRGRLKKKVGRDLVVLSDLDEADEEHASHSSDEEVGIMVTKAPANVGRRKRVVDDSDSE